MYALYNIPVQHWYRPGFSEDRAIKLELIYCTWKAGLTVKFDHVIDDPHLAL
jgi:hypothetical protein